MSWGLQPTNLLLLLPPQEEDGKGAVVFLWSSSIRLESSAILLLLPPPLLPLPLSQKSPPGAWRPAEDVDQPLQEDLRRWDLDSDEGGGERQGDDKHDQE